MCQRITKHVAVEGETIRSVALVNSVDESAMLAINQRRCQSGLTLGSAVKAGARLLLPATVDAEQPSDVLLAQALDSFDHDQLLFGEVQSYCTAGDMPRTTRDPHPGRQELWRVVDSDIYDFSILKV